MRQTPLHAIHAALGATFTDFAGWRMPLRYTSETAEHHAVRRNAGLFDLSHMGQIAVTGPQAAAALDFALTGRLSALAPGGARYTMLCHDNGGAEIAGLPVIIARTGYTGEDGFEIYCAAQDAAVVWAILHRAGGPRAVGPAGLACRDTLRLEAGMPLHGNELHVGITPMHAGLARTVDFGKPGDFVGRAALDLLRHEPPDRTLTGLTSSGRRPARAGYPITDLDTGAMIGTVTSGATSPTLMRRIALGYLPTRYAQPGTLVGVGLRGTVEAFAACAPKFYKGRTK